MRETQGRLLAVFLLACLVALWTLPAHAETSVKKLERKLHKLEKKTGKVLIQTTDVLLQSTLVIGDIVVDSIDSEDGGDFSIHRGQDSHPHHGERASTPPSHHHTLTETDKDKAKRP
jgi:hypothetical protein